MWERLLNGAGLEGATFLCSASSSSGIENEERIAVSGGSRPDAADSVEGSPGHSREVSIWSSMEVLPRWRESKLSQASTPMTTTTATPSEAGELPEIKGLEEVTEELFRLYRSLDAGKLRDLCHALAKRLPGSRADDVCACLLAADPPLRQPEFAEYLDGLFSEAGLQDGAERLAVLDAVLEEAGQQPLATGGGTSLRPAEKAMEALVSWIMDQRGSAPQAPAPSACSRGECGPPPLTEELLRWASRPKSREGYEFGDMFVKAAVRRLLSRDCEAADAAAAGEPTAAEGAAGASREDSSAEEGAGRPDPSAVAARAAALLQGLAGGCVPGTLSRPPCGEEAAATSADAAGLAASEQEFERLLVELFRLQDLNSDGSLEELELIQLNKKIAVLHFGKGVDKEALAAKYRGLFRSHLDPAGDPVSYATFRGYMRQVLAEMEPGDDAAQQMILEQFIAEAAVARQFFHRPSFESESDAPFLASLRLAEEPDEEELEVLEMPAALVAETGDSVGGPPAQRPRRPLWHELW